MRESLKYDDISASEFIDVICVFELRNAFSTTSLSDRSTRPLPSIHISAALWSDCRVGDYRRLSWQRESPDPTQRAPVSASEKERTDTFEEEPPRGWRRSHTWQMSQEGDLFSGQWQTG